MRTCILPRSYLALGTVGPRCHQGARGYRLTNRDSSPLARFHLVQGARPILMQKARERAVGEQAASGLAPRTIVSLVVRMPNPLNRGAASRTRQSIAAMHRHLGSKRGHLFRERTSGFRAQAIGPFDERGAGGVVKPRELRLAQLLRHRDWRKLCAMQYLVGIRVADSAEDARIGERALERVILGAQRGCELVPARFERFESARAE